MTHFGARSRRVAYLALRLDVLVQAPREDAEMIHGALNRGSMPLMPFPEEVGRWLIGREMMAETA